MIQNNQLIHNGVNGQLKQVKRNRDNNKRTYIRISVVGTLLFCTLLFVAAFSGLLFDQDAHAATTQPQELSYIEVESGDTLWSIASEHAGQEQDIREYVYELKRINDLENSNIQTGQKLLLP